MEIVEDVSGTIIDLQIGHVLSHVSDVTKSILSQVHSSSKLAHPNSGRSHDTRTASSASRQNVATVEQLLDMWQNTAASNQTSAPPARGTWDPPWDPSRMLRWKERVWKYYRCNREEQGLSSTAAERPDCQFVSLRYLSGPFRGMLRNVWDCMSI